MKRFVAFALKLGMLWSLAVISPTEALAIPAFARKYQTSCSTCHVTYPVLNSFGKAFKANGYRIPMGKDAFIKDKPVSLSAPAWKQVFPESLWPSDIPGSSVAALRGTGSIPAPGSRMNLTASTSSTPWPGAPTRNAGPSNYCTKRKCQIPAIGRDEDCGLGSWVHCPDGSGAWRYFSGLGSRTPRSKQASKYALRLRGSQAEEELL